MRQRYILFFFILLISIFAIVLPVAALFTDDYNYNQDIEFVNDGVAAIEQSLLFEINAAGLISNGYLQPDADDCTMQYMGAEEFLTAMNLSGTAAYWRVEHTRMPSGMSAKKTFWFGNPTMTRDQFWIGDDGDTCTVSSPGSFSFSGTQPFAIQVDIHPLTFVGTSQVIIGKGDSWQLSIEPGDYTDYYQWSVMSGSLNLVYSATIAAAINYTSTVRAWYNGEYIVIADGTNHTYTALPTGLVTNGSPVYVGHADCAINDLRITTPGSVSAPAGGAPAPAGNIYILGPDPTQLLLPDQEWPLYMVASDDSAAPLWLANGVIDEAGDDGHGWVWNNSNTEGWRYFYFDTPAWPGASNAIITGVSMYFGAWTTPSTTGTKIYKVGGGGLIEPKNDGSWDYNYPYAYWYPSIGSVDYLDQFIYGIAGQPVYFDYHTGTRTLTPAGQPWTITDLESLRFGLQLGTAGNTRYDLSECKLYVSVE